MQMKIIAGVLGIVIIIVIFIAVLMNNNVNSNNEKISANEHGDSFESYEITPGEVVKKIEGDENIILLDVRNPEEYEEIHLKNALLLPVQDLSQQSLANIGLGEDAKDKEIIIYCRSGARSKTAYNIMDSLGYTNIKSVAGGMIHWEEDDYPFTETGEYVGSQVMNDKKNTSTEMSNGPKITFNRIIHDFGVVPQSDGVVETVFEIKNIGNEILEIGELTTSCGCTSAIISKNSILPNENAQLTVYFDPDFHSEPPDKMTRTVFIPTNDPQSQEAEVKITVDILEDKI